MPGDPSFLEGAASSVASTKKPEISPEILTLLSGILAKSGGTTMQPTSAQPSLPPRAGVADPTQAGNFIPQGNFNSRGEHDRADAGAAMHSLANITRGAADYIHQKKTRDMQMSVERVMSAMDGLKEAKASGNKEAEQQNMQIINDMFSDPKKVKMFEKAFNIPLVGDHKNKNTPEYQGLQSAMRKWQADKSQGKEQGLSPVAQKFMGQQPVRQGMDPRLAIIQQLTKDKVLPSGGEQLTAQVETAKTVQKALANENTVQGKKDVASMLVGAKDRATKAGILNAATREVGRSGAAEISGRYRLASVAKAGQSMLESTMYRMAGNLLVKLAGEEGASKEVLNLSRQHQAVEAQVKDLTKKLKEQSEADHWYAPSDKDYKSNIEKLKGLQEKQKQIVQQMDKLNLKDKDAGSTDGTGSETSGEDGVDQVIDKIFTDSDSDEEDANRD